MNLRFLSELEAYPKDGDRRGSAAILSALSFLTLAVTGCATYEAQPILPERVAADLAVSLDDALSVAVNEFEPVSLPKIRFDLGNGLSPDEAAVAAVVLSPGLKATRNRVGLARAQLFQAGMLPDPSLSVGVDPVAFGNTTGEVTAWNAGLAWDIQKLVTRPARIAEAQRATDQVRLDVAWQEWQVALAARQATRDLQVLLVEQELAGSIRDRLERHLAVSEEAREVGDITINDIAAAEAAARDAALVVAELDRLIVGQRLTLNRTLGLPPESETELEALAEEATYDASALRDGFEARRFDLLALKQGYLSQEARVRAAILGQFPSVGLGLTAARDTGRVGTIGVGLSIGLPIFDGNRGQIAVERATREVLYDEYLDRVFQARADLAAALAEMEALTAELEAAKAATESLSSLVEGYRAAAGERDIDAFTLYLAENSLARKQIDGLELRRSRWTALTTAELASGSLSLQPSKELKDSP